MLLHSSTSKNRVSLSISFLDVVRLLSLASFLIDCSSQFMVSQGTEGNSELEPPFHGMGLRCHCVKDNRAQGFCCIYGWHTVSVHHPKCHSIILWPVILNVCIFLSSSSYHAVSFSFLHPLVLVPSISLVLMEFPARRAWGVLGFCSHHCEFKKFSPYSNKDTYQPRGLVILSLVFDDKLWTPPFQLLFYCQVPMIRIPLLVIRYFYSFLSSNIRKLVLLCHWRARALSCSCSAAGPLTGSGEMLPSLGLVWFPVFFRCLLYSKMER